MGLGPTVDAFGQGMMFHTALTVEWAQNHHTFVIDMEIYILWCIYIPWENMMRIWR